MTKDDNKPDLKVVPLYETNFRDTVAMLHLIADQIEAGEYGPVGSAALVVLGDKMQVFGMGPEENPCATGMLLHAGFQRMCGYLDHHGEDDDGGGPTG